MNFEDKLRNAVKSNCPNINEQELTKLKALVSKQQDLKNKFTTRIIVDV